MPRWLRRHLPRQPGHDVDPPPQPHYGAGSHLEDIPHGCITGPTAGYPKLFGSSIGNSMADYTFAGSAVGNRYQIELQERNSCGWGNITTHPLAVIDCGGGYEPFFKAPGQPAGESVAYPNPASNDLTLEQGGGPVRLTNAQGQTVRSQTAKPGRLHLDTHALPAGLYYLEMRDTKGQPVRKQIRIER